MFAEILNDKNYVSTVVNTEGLVLVDFFASWCAPCIKQAVTVEQIAQAHQDDLTAFKVDTGKSPAITNHYMVHSVPTMFLIREGQIVDHHIGVLEYDELDEWVKKNL